MDMRLLRQFARQDLEASRSAVQEAERKIASISKAVEKEGKDVDKSPKIKAFKELAKKPFLRRIDYKDADTNQIQTIYLTTGREPILTDSLKIHPWPSRLATLRHLDIGDDEIITVGGKERHITLMLKGEYDESAPDIKNATYLLRKETLLLESALALLGEKEPEEEVSKKPVVFGLKELVLKTDFEQDGTMRFPMRGFLRIEGVPGSGKTTVALQRIAYLIDRQYDELPLPKDSRPIFSQEKTLVLVLNEVLEIYLRRLLEDLDVRNVDIVSFNGFLTERFLGKTGYLSSAIIAPSSESSPWLELTKTRFEILQNLSLFTRRFVYDQLKPTLPRLMDEFSAALPRRFKSFSSKVNDVLDEFQSHISSGFLSFKGLVFGMADIESRVPKSGQTRNAWEQLNIQLVTTLKNACDPFNILANFYSSQDYENHLKNAMDLAWIKKYHRQQIKDALSEIRGQGKFTENDLALAAMIHLWLVSDLGSVTLPTHFKNWLTPLPMYSHIVIDEIQDFTEIQTRFISHLMQDQFKCITAVGDLTQKLRWPEGLESWERTGLFAKGHDVNLGVFKTNYRQTYQLGKLAYEYYKNAFDSEPPFIPVSKMEGNKPGLTVVKGFDREVVSMADIIRSMVKRLMSPTIAVIVEDDALREEYWKELVNRVSGSIKCQLSRGKDLTKLEVLHVVSLDDVKGLEFDAAVISDANKILHLSKTESAARTKKNRLYVAITRARKELHIFCHRTIPPILWQVRRDIIIGNTYVCKSCNSKNRISESLGQHTDGLMCGKCGEYQPPTFVTKDAATVSS